MAQIYREGEDGSIIELSNWGMGGADDPSKAMVGRKLTESQLELYQELKNQDRTDSSIWLEMHPAWPRGQGNEILKPLQRADVDLEKMKISLRQVTTSMLIKIIEARCQHRFDNLTKMKRLELESLAEAMLGRTYIMLDLNDC